MIGSFFRRLDEEAVAWLLISGQATILYGAATFSEDIDIWVEPTEENFTRFVGVLRACGARYYKLTPPLSVELAARKHGFHFLIPDADAGGAVFLDVMGQPPRVGAFREALRDARDFDTDWGKLRVVGIKDLVEIKKTQREQDYPIISGLALAYLAERDAGDDDLRWALENIFTLDAFKRLVVDYPAVRRLMRPGSAADRASAMISSGGNMDETAEDALDEELQRRAAELRKHDRRYWRPVIEELRELRRRGELMGDGTQV
jgi:hypothetical protein